MALSTRYIIALQQVRGYGAKTVKALADLSKNLCIETARELCEFTNSSIEAGKIARVKKTIELEDLEAAIEAADRILEASENYGIKAISYLDPEFPQNLLHTINEDGKPDVPIILYYKGDISIAKKKAVAIIGTREPTTEGIMAGEHYGELFASNGYNIVSGLAIGCDTAGHRGALKGKGVTTSFLAHGLDTIYPPENEDLAQQIVDNGGLLMSEYPIGTTVNRYNLVARDRLQAALADATIVIQTGVKGGTLHASNTTLKANKPLFCVRFKNLTFHEKTKGNDMLVQQGAKYILSTDALKQITDAIGDSNNQNYQLSTEHATPIQKSLFD